MPNEQPSNRRRSVVILGAFLYLWLMVGVALTTLSLLAAGRWLAPEIETMAWSNGALVAVLVVLGFAVVSFLGARWLLDWTLSSPARLVRAAIPLLVTLVALAGAWTWIGVTS